MKEFWVEVRPWNKNLATTALESGATAIFTDDPGKAKELARVTVIGEGGDLQPKKDVHFITISGKDDEEQAVNLSRNGWVVVSTNDWTVIPLENLVAQSNSVIAAVKNREEAELALTILEHGVAGILLSTNDESVIRDVGNHLRNSSDNFSLKRFTITRISTAGIGDRVCVDTTTLFNEGEGMLVGNTSHGFFLVNAETLKNPYVAPRPFRVNAGAVHAYIMRPDKRTAYLSDLSSGDRLLLIDPDGNSREVTVGRLKIEKRPMLLVEADCEGTHVHVMVQNAETVRLSGENGTGISVVSLKPGDRVYGFLSEEARHFGHAIKESILER